MALRRSSLLVAASVTFQLVAAEAAFASYDMSGKWLVTPTVRLEITQTDGHLESPIPVSFGGMFGTIDEDTGAFHLESYGRSLTHSPIFIDGDVAADSLTFDAIYSYSYVTGGTPTTTHVVSVSFPVTGTRCGNGDVDFGEECDDGNSTDGDCCSSACTFDVEGSSCDDEGDLCTFDVCNGAGTCGHVSHTGACAEPHGCGTGTCATGSCVITAPAAAGTSCDLDSSVCTVDACDGAGACAAGDALDCSPCGICDAADGCVAYDPEPDYYNYCDENPSDVSLSIRSDADARRDRLTLKLRDETYGTTPGALTSYTICIFEDGSTAWPPLWSATIPTSATCNDRDCWKATGRGFSYKDSAASADGVAAFSIDREKGFKLKGKGANLDLPAELPASPYSLRYRIQANSEFGAMCWRNPLQTDESSATEYKGSRVAP